RRPALGGAARRVGHGAAGHAGPGHPPPRRPVRRLRSPALRAEGAAGPAGRAGVPAPAGTGGAVGAGRRGGGRGHRPHDAGGRAARRRAHHRAPALLAAVPGAVQPAQPERPVGAAARRPRPAAGPGPPRRVLLGRLLAVEHAVPPGRRRAGGLHRRRRDRRDAPDAVGRSAAPRPGHRPDQRRRRAARHRRRHPARRGVDRARGRPPPPVAGALPAIAAAPRRAGGWTVLEDDPRLPPAAVADDLCKRYEGLWHELTTDELIPEGEEWRVADRVQRLNDLGYDVAEIELVDDPGEDGRRFRLTTRVVEPGHHRRRLLQLTGLDVQENQARRLLNDILAYRTAVEAETGVALGEQIAAMRWMVEIFEPTLARVPAELRDRLEDAEIYHQILEHRWFLSERAGRDVGLEAATDDYLAAVLPAQTAERTVLDPATSELPVIGGPDPEVT